MTSLLNQMDVYVLPVFNIDGYEYTHTNVSYIFGLANAPSPCCRPLCLLICCVNV